MNREKRRFVFRVWGMALLTAFVGYAMIDGGQTESSASAALTEDSKNWQWWRDGNGMAGCEYAHTHMPPRHWEMMQVWDNQGRCLYRAWNPKETRGDWGDTYK